ncbi:MAG: hypothetical protein AUG51_18625 [Acidobacteria bacterium 13_1_20CM_3_53_8]|nr:MAG: hypothetical protein AUG51_18625 [Acidobacteria bacterium 13_1_20CM_3_53_8]
MQEHSDAIQEHMAFRDTPQRADAMSDPGDGIMQSLIPNKVDCALHITFEEDLEDKDKTPHCYEVPMITVPDVEWNYRTVFTNLDQKAQEHLQSHLKEEIPELESRSIYRRHGSCRIVCGGEAEEAEELNDTDQWPLVPSGLIARFVNVEKNQYKPFHLEWQLVYSDLQLHPDQTTDFTLTVQKEISRKMKPNYNKEKYISRNDVFKIASAEWIPKIIDDDRSLQNLSSESDFAKLKKDLVNAIIGSAPRLLAICVHVGIKLAFLKDLLDHRINDTDLPLNTEKCREKYPDCAMFELNKLIDGQGSFLAHKFEKGHQEVGTNIVLPIYYNKVDDLLGRGAHGDVYKIQIDPDYHLLSKVGICFSLSVT